MAIVSSQFIRWGITKFSVYIVQFDGESSGETESIVIFSAEINLL